MNHLSLMPNQSPGSSVPNTLRGSFHHGHVHRGHHHETRNTPTATTGSGGNTLPSTVSSSGGGGTQALSSADMLSSSLAGLNTAIAQLRSQLDSLLGISQPSTAVETTAPTATGASAGTTSATSGVVGVLDMGAHFISKQRGELTITTQEGDVVTLKFSNKVSVDYASSQASDGTTSASMETLSVRSRSRIGIAVEGDLNDKELAAINNLVGKVGQLTDEFYNGNVDQALAAAGDLSFDTSQLSDMSLSLSLRQRFYAQGSAIWAAPASPTLAPPVSAPTSPVLPVVDPATAEQVASAIDQTGTAAATTTEPADQPAAQGSQSAGDSAAAATSTSDPVAGAPTTTSPSEAASPPATQTPASATQVVASFVAKVRESLHVSSTDNSLGFSYDFKVRLLLSAIVINAPAAPATSPADTTADPSSGAAG